jgi:hypothetical protein
LDDPQRTVQLLRALQLLLAIPLLALVGQGVLNVLVRVLGQDPARNAFYRLLALIASPVTRACRYVAPRFVADRHVPLVALCLLAAGYLWTMAAIAQVCSAQGLAIAQCLR